MKSVFRSLNLIAIALVPIVFANNCSRSNTTIEVAPVKPVFSTVKPGELVVMVGTGSAGWHYRVLDLSTATLGRVIYSSPAGAVAGSFRTDGAALTGFFDADSVSPMHQMIVREVDLANGKTRKTGVDAFISDQPEFSPDGRLVAMIRTDTTGGPSNLALWDPVVDTVVLRPLAGQSIIEPHWLRDGSGIVAIGRSPVGIGLYCFRMEAQSWEVLLAPRTAFSAGRLAVNPMQPIVTFCGQFDSLSGIFSFDLRNKRMTRIAGIDARECTFSPTGDTIAIIIQTKDGSRLAILAKGDTTAQLIPTKESVCWPNWVPGQAKDP